MQAPPSAFPGGSQPDLQKVFAYLPMILKLLSSLPGVLFGFLVAVVYLLLIVGPTSFKVTVSPVAGFHLLVLFVWRELHPTVEAAVLCIRQKRRERREKENLTSDILMSFHSKLD